MSEFLMGAGIVLVISIGVFIATDIRIINQCNQRGYFERGSHIIKCQVVNKNKLIKENL